MAKSKNTEPEENMNTEDQTFENEPLNEDHLSEKNDNKEGGIKAPKGTPFNPLAEPVKQREYTKPQFNVGDMDEEIPEPEFTPPNFADLEDEDGAPDAEQRSFNPEMNDLDNKEKKIASEQMVDTVLEMYGQAHHLANNYVRLNDKKVMKMMQDGEIDPNLQVPVDAYGNTVAVIEYVEDYNEQLTDAIELDEEFVTKVKPPMMRVFQKRGLAMTDEQYLMFAFGSDIVTKGAMLYQLKAQNKQMLTMWKDQSAGSVKSAPKKPNPKPEPESKPEAESKPKPKKKEYVEPEEDKPFTAESMVDDMVNSKSNFEEVKKDPSMPDFGDADMLKKIDELEKQSQREEAEKEKKNNPPKTTKRKRGRPKKAKK